MRIFSVNSVCYKSAVVNNWSQMLKKADNLYLLIGNGYNFAKACNMHSSFLSNIYFLSSLLMLITMHRHYGS